MASLGTKGETGPESMDSSRPSLSLRFPAVAGFPAPAAPAALPAPQGNLETFFALCPSPVVQADLEGRITSWNPAAAQFYGYSAAEMIGCPVSTLAPASMSRFVQRKIELLTAGHAVENFETTAVTRDGRRIDVSLTIFPVHDANGHCVGCGSISQDISARKKADLALAQSEQRFRAAFDITPAAMSLIALDGRFLQVNRATCAMLGYAADEMRGMPVADILLPEDATPDPVAELLRRARDPECNRELRLVRRDGSVCWVNMAVEVMVDELGRPASFLTHGQDLTEQRAAQARLATLSAQFRDVLDRVGGAHLDVDRNLRVIRANAAAEEMFAGDRRPLAGQRLPDIVDPATMGDFAGFLNSALRDQQPVQIAEYFWQPRQIWASAQIIPTAEGMAVHVRDITA